MTTRITTDNITDGQVKTADLADTEVTNGKLASTAVTSSKMSGLVTINILASDGSTVVKTIFTRFIGDIMTTREPLIYDSTLANPRRMTSSEISIVNQCAYEYGQDPSVTLTVESGLTDGNISVITDTRKSAQSTSTTSFPSESTTQEPQTVTVNYNRVTQYICLSFTNIRWWKIMHVHFNFWWKYSSNESR